MNKQCRELWAYIQEVYLATRICKIKFLPNIEKKGKWFGKLWMRQVRGSKVRLICPKGYKKTFLKLIFLLMHLFHTPTPKSISPLLVYILLFSHHLPCTSSLCHLRHPPADQNHPHMRPFIIFQALPFLQHCFPALFSLPQSAWKRGQIQNIVCPLPPITPALLWNQTLKLVTSNKEHDKEIFWKYEHLQVAHHGKLGNK